ncbi:MAG: aerobic-type carbon monoxide dehydrogenase small subunit CoxS/CutS-like protein [Fusobacteria bacterium]|nr:MAG: aerobic-type carbon monoxide dehydrogenase small subunit CoxS/CutS-like protein [Fusobacteriota bacterium]KAF0230268.1 MAG: aerobic-type carbon monoxide dehydrogenase small subunit CoxS/CutS-like [Fusobacteriota bacterium]
MNKINVNMIVNGEVVSILVEPNARLLDTLRDNLELTGTKEGCGVGECGACTVIVDGEAVNSCMILAASMEGKVIETIEGLGGDNGELHILQEKFIEHSALQCGFCTPGLVMSAKAFLDVNDKPTREEIKTAISGNLCRCTGYSQIVDAIEDAAKDYYVYDVCRVKK